MRPFARNPLPRAVMMRLETGRIVVLSVLLGLLVGGLCIFLRLILDALAPLGYLLAGYSPPGTLGEGGLLIAFGRHLAWGLLFLPFVGALYAWLVPALPGNALAQLVRGYNTRDGWPEIQIQLRTLLGTVMAYTSGLLVGRDAPFTLLGQLGTNLLGRATQLDALEKRTLMLAGAAAGLGTVLHAPLAAAVLVAEVLYRRFEFEFEVLLPCILASVVAYAVYGLGFGFDPLFDVLRVQLPSVGQLPALILVAALVTGAAWALLWACRLVPNQLTDGWLRPFLGSVFGFLTALCAVTITPTVLGDGVGWLQVGVGGFLSAAATGDGVWRWLLLALGARLAFGGGVLPSVGTGGLLGVGLGQWLGLDPLIAGLTGAVAFLTVTLNVPVSAALFAIAWGGDAILPVVLIAAGVAHAISGESGIVPAQLRSRSDSPWHSNAPKPTLPETVRFVPRLAPATPVIPFDAPKERPATPEYAPNERELYRRPVPTSWQGTELRLLTLPAGIELISVVRDGEVRMARPELTLTADDELVLLARPDDYKALEKLLRLPSA